MGALIMMCAVAGSAAAQAAASTTKLTADVGFVNTSGNTKITTLSTNEKLGFSKLGWGLEQTYSIIYGKSHDTVNTSLWRASLRGERKIDGRLSAILGGTWDKNKFAGLDHRLEEYLGLRLRAIAAEADSMDLQFAGSLTQQKNVNAASDNFTALRIASSYKHTFSTKSYVTEGLEYIPNLDETTDYRVNNEVALVAPLSAKVGLKLTYVVRFDNLPPATFKKSDTFLTAGVQITF
jgi:putative salt-induced outer membrane protein